MVHEKRERNEQIFQRYRDGKTYQQIGEEFGLAFGRVGEIIRAERCKMPLRDRAEIIQDMAAQLDAMRNRAEEIVNADPPIAMSQGKPVPLRSPDGRKVKGKYAADVGASLAAMKVIVDVQARQSRLLGTDQPVQTRTEGSMTIEMKGIEDV